MQRRILGIAAVCLALVATMTALTGGGEAILSFCWRGGAILAAAWLAYDDIQRLPTWLVFSLPALLLLIAWRPRLLVVIVPALILWALLRRGRDTQGTRM